jgi:hypothetical protein
MKRHRSLSGLAVLTILSLSPLTAQAVDLGQIDTFEDGTTQGWITGGPHPFPPVNISSGGPAGADDNYLLITALGTGGPGGRLASFNLSQWGGDYLAAGVTTIRMDVNNFGTADLSLRLLLADPMFGPPSNIAISSDAVLVPAGSGWTSVDFPVDLSSLIALAGDTTSALSGATELRLFHGVDPTFPGAPIATTLGVDNIQAAVPEPSAVLAFGMGTLLCMVSLRSRRRR